MAPPNSFVESDVYDEELRGSMTAKKTDWTSTYVSPTPAKYIEALDPLDYGHFQDRLQSFLLPVMDRFCVEGKKYKAVEFGALYGNTSLAYKFNKNWRDTVKVWRDDDAPLTPRHDIEIIASDISKPALEYGKQRGIFDEICVFDFNQSQLTPILQDGLVNGDFLFIVMATNYLKTEAFQNLLRVFLTDRSKPKMLVYNVVCAFDTRNLSPEVILADQTNMEVETHFAKHRNFSKEESDARQGCKESWSYTFVVTFHPTKIVA